MYDITDLPKFEGGGGGGDAPPPGPPCSGVTDICITPTTCTQLPTLHPLDQEWGTWSNVLTNQDVLISDDL